MPVPSHPPSLPLHRIRFFDHTPTPITALSFAPLPLPPAQDPNNSSTSTTSAKGKERLPTQFQDNGNGKPEMGLLVLAREGGEVEVWEYVGPENKGMGNWVMQKVSEGRWAGLWGLLSPTGVIGAQQTPEAR